MLSKWAFALPFTAQAYHREHQKGNADDNHPNADVLYLLLSLELVYNEVFLDGSIFNAEYIAHPVQQISRRHRLSILHGWQRVAPILDFLALLQPTPIHPH